MANTRAYNTDKFKKGARRFSTVVGASGIPDAAIDTIPLASTVGLPTDTAIEITIDRVNPSGDLTPAQEEIVTGVVSGNFLIDCIRGTEGTAQSHAAGAVVEIRLTANQWNDIIDGILVEHNQDGSHKDNVFPIGIMSPFAGSAAPTGFLMCDGREVSRIDYVELFDVIGTNFGEGNGSTTFNLPNPNNRSLIGAGDEYTLGQIFGSKTHNLSHGHTINDHSHSMQGHTHGLRNHTHNYSHKHMVSRHGDTCNHCGLDYGSDYKGQTNTQDHTETGHPNYNTSDGPSAGSTGGASSRGTSTELGSINITPRGLGINYIIKY